MFLYLLLTKAYVHILPEINAEIYFFGLLFPEKAVWILPALFSFPISLLTGVSAFIILNKANQLALKNRDMMELNALLADFERIKIKEFAQNLFRS